MEIKDIVDFMSVNVNRTEEEKAEMTRYFEEKLQTDEYSLASDPVEALYLDVSTAPFVFAREMGIAGPFRAFEDYLYNGKVQVHKSGLNTDINGYSLENMEIRSSDTGLTSVAYSATLDNTSRRLRNEYYYNGTLLARECFRSIDGTIRNEVTVFDNNPLVGTFLPYLQDNPIPELGLIGRNPTVYHSDDVVPQPSNDELVKDFVKSFTRPTQKIDNLSSDSRKDELELIFPTYRFDDGGDTVEVSPEWVHKILMDYIDNHKDDENLKKYKEVLPFFDNFAIISDVMKNLEDGGLLTHLESVYDSQGEFESREELDKAIEAYISNSELPYAFDYYLKNCLPSITDELDNAYDKDRENRVYLLRNGYAPLSPDFALLERYDAINKGLYGFAHNAAECYSDADKMDNQWEKLKKYSVAVDSAFADLDKRLFVTKLSDKAKEESLACVLSGPNYFEIHPNESLQDVVDDYKTFKENVLPVFSSEKLFFFSIDESINILNTIVENKDNFKTALFKNAFDEFCNDVGNVLRTNPNESILSEWPLNLISNGFDPLYDLPNDTFNIPQINLCAGNSVIAINSSLKGLDDIYVKLIHCNNKEEAYNDIAKIMLEENGQTLSDENIKAVSADLKTAYSMLPKLKKAENAFNDTYKEADASAKLDKQYLAIKAYADVFINGRLSFKSEMFSKPCVAFCETITRTMKNDEKLAVVINTGKLPAAGKVKTSSFSR